MAIVANFSIIKVNDTFYIWQSVVSSYGIPLESIIKVNDTFLYLAICNQLLWNSSKNKKEIKV